MQRKPGFPVANCSIKMPDCSMMPETMMNDDDTEQHQRRQQLINFGHAQWGFNNWSWSVTKQDLDFVDLANGKYSAGVVAFVSITVKSFDIHRENIGYATSVANTKGFAIYKSRKCAVTNALRETLLSFGGNVSTELNELLEGTREPTREPGVPANAAAHENNQNVANLPHVANNIPIANNVHSVNNGTMPTVNNMPSVNNVANKPSEVVSPHRARKESPRAPLAPAVPGAVPPAPRPPLGPRPAPPRPNSNDAGKVVDTPVPSGPSDEEARAERKRRQRQAQEEFRQKQMMKQLGGPDEKSDLSRASSTFDKLLLDLPSQDVVIDATADETAKRKSPASDGGLAKRRNSFVKKLDIVPSDS